jgi:hypothetical protein
VLNTQRQDATLAIAQSKVSGNFRNSMAGLFNDDLPSHRGAGVTGNELMA